MGGGGRVGASLGSTTIFSLLLCTSLVVSYLITRATIDLSNHFFFFFFFFTLWHERVRGNPSTPLKNAFKLVKLLSLKVIC